MNPAVKLKSLLEWLTSQSPSMLQTLKTFVCTESPSTEKAAADACACAIAREWRKRPVRVELFNRQHRGAHLRISIPSTEGKPRGHRLVLGHYDTVYAPGTLAKMPFRAPPAHVYSPPVFHLTTAIFHPP